MAIVNTHYGFCAKGGAAVKFTYTGEYNVRDDGVVELLTSGTIVFLEPKVIDLFMVGGGGGGGGFNSGDNPNSGYGGGGGGYARTLRKVNVTPNTAIAITIGAGGASRQNGNSTAFANNEVAGGHGPIGTFANLRQKGANGGSGGGGGVISNSDFGTGGSDGTNGETGFPTSIVGGTGQNFSTREFGERTGKLYAGGGGGGRYMSAQSPIVSIGGAGGGGSGGFSATDAIKQAAAAGVANTGGGGGGGSIGPDLRSLIDGASGGSGIVCFREAQELPELAGTWMLNERLYAPENTINQTIQFTAKEGATSAVKAYANFYSDTSALKFTVATGSITTVYTYSSNTWNTKYKYLTFPAGAAGSDEFRAWLASNATKQS